MRDITVYEEGDPAHMFGYQDHVNHITVFEVRKCGIGYRLFIDGEEPDWITVNGKRHVLVEPSEAEDFGPVASGCPQCGHHWLTHDTQATCQTGIGGGEVCDCAGMYHHS